MTASSRRPVHVAFLGATVACAASSLSAQTGAPDQPAVTVRGQTYAPRSILSRNMGAPNPFIDPANSWLEADIQEAMFRAQLQLQQKR